MKSICVALVAAVTMTFAHPAVAKDSIEISWSDLMPQESEIYDPFAKLETSQLSDLANLYRIESDKNAKDDTESRQRAQDIRERLVSQGLDPDLLFQQRKTLMQQRMEAGSALNPDVLNKPVRLPGYLLPLTLDGQKTVEFLLVPFVGACIHTPPPPPNQMVLVHYETGFDVDAMFKPVWISGALEAESHATPLYLVDGEATIESTYFMDAKSVEIYE